MDIFDRIKEDHDMFRDLLDQAKKAAKDDKAKSEELFAEIDRQLRAHHETEEHSVFPALQQKDKTRDITEESYEEHQSIDCFLRYVRESDRNVRWHAKIGVLKEITTHHLDEEENQMFPKGREVLLEEELTGLVEQFNTMKQERLDKLS